MCLLHEPISRRGVLRGLLASSALVALPWRAARADGAYDGPFVDAHAHLKWDAGVSSDDLIALYDSAGVQSALLFGEPWPLAADARDRYPGRAVPLLAERYANAVHRDASYAHPDGLEQLHRPLANARHLCGHVSRVKPLVDLDISGIRREGLKAATGQAYLRRRGALIGNQRSRTVKSP